MKTLQKNSATESHQAVMEEKEGMLVSLYRLFKKLVPKSMCYGAMIAVLGVVVIHYVVPLGIWLAVMGLYIYSLPSAQTTPASVTLKMNGIGIGIITFLCFTSELLWMKLLGGSLTCILVAHIVVHSRSRGENGKGGGVEMSRKRWLKENWLFVLALFAVVMGGVCLFGALNMGGIIIPASESANVEASMQNLVHAGLTFLIAGWVLFLIYLRCKK